MEELRKLEVLLKTKELKLLLPEQVMEEFWRNRDSKIADALKLASAAGAPRANYPPMLQEYDEYPKLRKSQQETESLHAELMKKAEVAANDRTFLADSVIVGLFDRGTRVSVTNDQIERARRRRDLGNPPGKKDSLGDALNWETLLDVAEPSEDLYFISEDKDWISPLGAGLFNSFLSDEWRQRKSAKIVYYSRLSGFFKQHYPKIELAREAEKDLLIRDLSNSASFAQTHRLIASLQRYSDFTPAQINDIVGAYLSNGQVNLIIHDSDVRSFITKTVAGREKDIDPGLREGLISLLAKPEPALW